MIRCSQRAILLMVTEEDGDQNYYVRFEEHFSWPGGASGPTVGVGFDCGYETRETIAESWSQYIDAKRVGLLQEAAGLKGQAARAWVAEHGHMITITWDESLDQFDNHELPRWEGITRGALPNCDLLSGDSFGALVSITYNRGPSGWTTRGSRFAEMNRIHALMAAQQFALIPNQILGMRRLWPVGKDLWNRRTHEALLFRDGLIPAPKTS